MKLAEVKKLAAQRGLTPGNLDKAEIIRAIQAAEGNPTCFDAGASAECGQEKCLWRSDCK